MIDGGDTHLIKTRAWVLIFSISGWRTQKRGLGAILHVVLVITVAIIIRVRPILIGIVVLFNRVMAEFARVSLT